MFGKKTNKKPFGLKIQSATLATNYTPTIQVFKKACSDFLSEDLFCAFFSRKVNIDAFNKDIEEPRTVSQ